MSTAHYVDTKKEGKQSNTVLVALFWLYVSIPLAWGVFSTMQKAAALLH